MNPTAWDFFIDRTLNPPASESALIELSKIAEGRLPDDYLALLRIADGGCGFVGDNYLLIYAAADVVREGRFEEFMPHLLFFASNGGGEGFAWDLSRTPLMIVNVPFIGMTDEGIARDFGTTIDAFLRRLQAAPLFPS